MTGISMNKIAFILIIIGPTLYHPPRPDVQPNMCSVVSQADVLSRHIIALERHVEYATKLTTTSTAVSDSLAVLSLYFQLVLNILW